MNLYNLSKSEDILTQICNYEIVVFEDIQGSKLFVRYDGKNFEFIQKNINSEPISLLDLSLQKYYNKAINYFYALPDRAKKLLSKNYHFCFEYFPDNQPANIEYKRVPKNNLILTGICKNKKYNYTIQELIEYANLLDVDHLPVVFQGMLDKNQKEAIKYFLSTSEEDLEYVFGDKNFAFFFYKLLNPNIKNSFLMDDGEFQPNLERLIIKIKDKNTSFKILNPLYKTISDNNKTEYTDVYTLILFNFLKYCQTINFKDLRLVGSTKDELYINLICKLYNMYMNDSSEDISLFNFSIPKFFSSDKFKINIDLINNKLTTQYISKNEKYEYIFKIILGSFSKKKKKVIGIFNENTLEIFNSFVDEIDSLIDKYLNKVKEYEIRNKGLMDFDDFFDIKYDTDGNSIVYPDVYIEFEDGNMDSLDKKKKGISKK